MSNQELRDLAIGATVFQKGTVKNQENIKRTSKNNFDNKY